MGFRRTLGPGPPDALLCIPINNVAETAEAMIKARERRERRMIFFLREEGGGDDVSYSGWSWMELEEPPGSDGEGPSLP